MSHRQIDFTFLFWNNVWENWELTNKRESPYRISLTLNQYPMNSLPNRLPSLVIASLVLGSAIVSCVIAFNTLRIVKAHNARQAYVSNYLERMDSYKK